MNRALTDGNGLSPSRFDSVLKGAKLDPGRATLLADTPVLHSGWGHDSHLFLFEYEGRRRVILADRSDAELSNPADLLKLIEIYSSAIATTVEFLQMAEGAYWMP